MSSKSYYLKQKSQWSSEQSSLNGKAKRLNTALSSLNSQIKDFDNNKDDYEKKYKKIDNGSGADDWEGQSVIDAREKLKSNVKAHYTTLEEQYDSVVSKMREKITYYTEQAEAAGDKVTYYDGLINECDDND